MTTHPESEPAGPIIRDNRGRFVKGGAPRMKSPGRPKGHGDVMTYARGYTIEAVDKIISLMRDSEDHNIQLRAAVALLERGWGKPVQAVELPADMKLTVEHQLGVAQYREVPQDELLAQRQRLRAELEARAAKVIEGRIMEAIEEPDED